MMLTQCAEFRVHSRRLRCSDGEQSARLADKRPAHAHQHHAGAGRQMWVCSCAWKCWGVIVLLSKGKGHPLTFQVVGG